MKLAKEVRVGNLFKKDGKLLLVLKAQLHKSTAGRRAATSEIKFKLKDLMSKNNTEMTVDATEKMNNIILDKKESQFLYKDSTYHFMNQETFEQFELDESNLGDAIHFLKDEAMIDVLFFEGKPIGVELPNTMVLTIQYTEPGLRGDTTGKVTKPATLESGLELHIPLFCNIGDKIKVDTRTLEYMERA